MDKLELKPINLATLSLITGIFGGALTLAIALLAGWPWVYSVLGWAAIAAISWLLLMRRYLAIATGETNNDVSFSHAKIYPAESTRIEITANDPSGQFSSGRFCELPVDLPTFIKVCRLLNDGGDLSHAGLSGIHRPLSRSQYEVLRNKMIRDGLAYWRDPLAHSMGCDLTAAGRAVVKRFASSLKDEKKLSPNGGAKVRLPHFSSRAAQAHKPTRGNGRRQLIRD